MSKIKKYANSEDARNNKVTKEFAEHQRKEYLKKKWKKYKPNVFETLPLRFIKKFKTYDFSKIEKQEAKSIFIYGECGTGKSVMSAYLYIDFVRQLFLKKRYNISYHFVIFPNFLFEIQRNYSQFFEVLEKYAECDILVLDDFSAKKMTEFVYDSVYFVLNERCLNNRITIINSNHNLESLANIFDDRIVRRIDEDYEFIEKKRYKKS